MRDALRSPNFGLFWLAQTISRFGDPITLIALAAASFRLTGSAFYTSLAVVVATVPQATFGFFGGAIADALGHRRAMVPPLMTTWRINGLSCDRPVPSRLPDGAERRLPGTALQ